MRSDLLLYSSNPQDREFCEAVAAQVGLRFVEVKSSGQMVEAIQAQTARFHFFGFETPGLFSEFETLVQDQIGMLSPLIQPNRYFFIGSAPIHKVEYLLQSNLFGGYILRFPDQAKVTGTRFGTICAGIKEERKFGLERFAPGAQIQTVTLERASQKQETVDAVRRYLQAAKFSTRASNAIANAMDELLMNAIFDAPVDKLGRHIYLNTPRTKEIELQGQAKVQVQIAYNQETVAISACDLFGSLNKSKVLAHISKEYSKGEYKIRAGTAGAGIGLANVFQLGGSFCFTTEVGVRTEATVFFSKTDTFKDFKNQFRFLLTQFFLAQEGAGFIGYDS